jgi:hypothetical protein
MLRRPCLAIILVVAAMVVGCAGPDETTDDPNADPLPLIADENGCHGTATLDGYPRDQSTSGNVSFGPHAFGQARFCLHLDASENRDAHFMVGTTRFDGEIAPLALELQRPDGSPIASGDDIVINRNPPHRVFASLELAIDGGTVEDVVLVVDGSATSEVSASLFERLE